ncbi:MULTISPECIES: integrase core domain-containing protein [unclassified Nonomuraea]|uniref:integrase core domain-containing protein n=1 Tax=unclassified Nonomuraea TaxID=2593643 RepID=UPI0033FA358A
MRQAQADGTAGAKARGPVKKPARGPPLQGAKRWSSAHEARLAVFKWITRYNTRRRHSTLGYLSPIDYEQQTTDKVLLAA